MCPQISQEKPILISETKNGNFFRTYKNTFFVLFSLISICCCIAGCLSSSPPPVLKDEPPGIEIINLTYLPDSDSISVQVKNIGAKNVGVSFNLETLTKDGKGCSSTLVETLEPYSETEYNTRICKATVEKSSYGLDGTQRDITYYLIHYLKPNETQTIIVENTCQSIGELKIQTITEDFEEPPKYCSSRTISVNLTQKVV